MRVRRTFGRTVTTVSWGVGTGSAVALVIMASWQAQQDLPVIGGGIRLGTSVNQYSVPPCTEEQVVVRSGECVHIDRADYREGYWYRTN